MEVEVYKVNSRRRCESDRCLDIRKFFDPVYTGGVSNRKLLKESRSQLALADDI